MNASWNVLSSLNQSRFLSSKELMLKLRSRMTVILGGPGTGKTSAMRDFLLDWAHCTLPVDTSDPKNYFPIYLELEEYGEIRQNDSKIGQGGNLLNYIQNTVHQNIATFPATDQVVIILDGLDEVLEAALRNVVMNDIALLVNDMPQNCRLVVTSRVAGYNPTGFTNLRHNVVIEHYLLQPLSESQISEFLDNWHRHFFTPTEIGNSRRERLQLALSRSRAMAEIAKIPVLLTAVAYVNLNPDLPSNHELLKKCSDLFISRWRLKKEKGTQGNRAESSKNDTILTTTIIEKLLKKLAWKMLESMEVVNSISKEGIVEVFQKNHTFANLSDSEVILGQIHKQHGILCYRGNNCFGFLHAQFLEYYGAREIQDRFERREIDDEQFFHLILTRQNCVEWQGALVIACGLLPETVAFHFIEKTLEQLMDPVLAARCLEQVRAVHFKERWNRLHATILTALLKSVANDVGIESIELLARLWPEEDWGAIIEIIARSNDSRAGFALDQLMRSSAWMERGRAKSTLAEIARSGKEGAVTAMEYLAITEPDDNVIRSLKVNREGKHGFGSSESQKSLLAAYLSLFEKHEKQETQLSSVKEEKQNLANQLSVVSEEKLRLENQLSSITPTGLSGAASDAQLIAHVSSSGAVLDAQTTSHALPGGSDIYRAQVQELSSKISLLLEESQKAEIELKTLEKDRREAEKKLRRTERENMTLRNRSRLQIRDAAVATAKSVKKTSPSQRGQLSATTGLLVSGVIGSINAKTQASLALNILLAIFGGLSFVLTFVANSYSDESNSTKSLRLSHSASFCALLAGALQAIITGLQA